MNPIEECERLLKDLDDEIQRTDQTNVADVLCRVDELCKMVRCLARIVKGER